MTTATINSDQSKKLAVIVPVYNVEKYLAKCLDSLINQTYKNLQIICVNDGSPDNCSAILDDYAKKDERIVVLNKENGGLSSARNAALDYLNDVWAQDKSKCAELVAFVDSDDYVDLDAYENCLKNYTDEIDVIGFGSQFVYDDGSLDSGYDDSNRAGLSGRHHLSNDVISSTSLSVCNKIFRTKTIFENNLRFPKGLNIEDAFFTTVFLCLSSCIWFENSRYYKYLRGRLTSITGSAWQIQSKLCRDYIKILIAVYEYLKSNELYDTKKDAYWSLFYHLFKDAMSTKHSSEDDVYMYSEARKILLEDGHSGKTSLEKRYDHMILSGTFSESKRYILFGLIKYKHRVTYDKYSFLGIPVLKVSYTDDCRIISILGILKFRSK